MEAMGDRRRLQAFALGRRMRGEKPRRRHEHQMTGWRVAQLAMLRNGRFDHLKTVESGILADQRAH
jgi:hypothetical protein